MIDSLLSLVQNEKPETNKVLHFNKLSWSYRAIGDSTNANKYGNEALLLATRLKFKWGIADAHNNLGLACWLTNDYSRALEHYFVALKLFKELNKVKAIGNCYNNIGIICREQGNYPEALKYYYAGLKAREEVKDTIGVANLYGSMGSIYYYQGNYVEALRCYNSQLKTGVVLRDKTLMAKAYQGIGNVQVDQLHFVEALASYRSCLDLYKQIDFKQGISGAYNNIGSVYVSQAEGFAAAHDKVNADQLLGYAVNNYKEALAIKEAISDEDGMVVCYINLGEAYAELGDYGKSRSNYLSAVKLGTELESWDALKDSHEGLSRLDSATGDFKSAAREFLLYIQYNDSLFNDENTRKSVHAQMNYEFNKKTAADSVRNAKDREIKNEQIRTQDILLEQDKIHRISLYGGMALILLFSAFIFSRFRITNQHKRIIEHQKELVEEIQKEILDSILYAKRIQQSLLPTEKYIEKHLNRNRHA